MGENLLKIENLSVNCGEKKILHDINFSIRRGEILIIAGESGSGKSTILKAIGGLLGKNFILNGKIFFCGQDITKISDFERRKIAGEEIGMIFQNAGASFCPIRKIGDQIFESVRVHRDFDKKSFLKQAKSIMQKINLDFSVLNEYPFKLSGGMAQRAGILAATILKPKLLLADEATSALDVVTQAEVVKELLKLRDSEQISIILVTHDLKIAKKMADNVLILRKGGEIAEFGTRDQIFITPKESYTRELIKAANL